MDAGVEKLVDVIVQERMQDQYSKWREAESGEDEKAESLRLESEYEKAIAGLEDGQQEAVKQYIDSIFDSGAESEAFFYRLGVRDGIRLWKFMKKLMKTVS